MRRGPAETTNIFTIHVRAKLELTYALDLGHNRVLVPQAQWNTKSQNNLLLKSLLNIYFRAKLEKFVYCLEAPGKFPALKSTAHFTFGAVISLFWALKILHL